MQYLLIVRRDRPDLRDYLTRVFSGDRDVQVILDRRHGQRQGAEGHEPERRRGDRRHQPSLAEDSYYSGFVITRPDRGRRKHERRGKGCRELPPSFFQRAGLYQLPHQLSA